MREWNKNQDLDFEMRWNYLKKNEKQLMGTKF
jgi:hypothetical protein